MSDHHCHEGCECEVRDWELDTGAIAAAARERGASMPVLATAVDGDLGIEDWPDKYPQPSENEYVGGTAGHWAPDADAPIELHVIRIRAGVPAIDAIQILLHEIEHCIQSEGFPSGAAWHAAYKDDPMAWEAPAVEAEADWLEYGHLLTTDEEGTSDEG